MWNTSSTGSFKNLDGLCLPSLTTQVFLTVFLLLIIFTSVVGNVILCGIVYRRVAMHSGINLLLASLASADFCIAIFNMSSSLIVLNLTKWPFGDFVCSLNGFIFLMVNADKIILLLIITIDRYFIIVKRKDTMTPTKAKTLIGLSWLIAISVSIPPVFGWGNFVFRQGFVQCLLDFNNHNVYGPSYTVFICTTIIFFPALVLAILYHRILRTVRRNCFRIQNHPPVTPTAMHKKGKLFIDYSHKTRTSTTILLLSFIHITALLPIAAANVYLAENGFSSTFTTCKYTAFLFIPYASGLLNVVVYYTRIKKFRESIDDLWPPFCSWPHLIPKRSRRRVRPQVVYRVEKNDKAVVLFPSNFKFV